MELAQAVSQVRAMVSPLDHGRRRQRVEVSQNQDEKASGESSYWLGCGIPERKRASRRAEGEEGKEGRKAAATREKHVDAGASTCDYPLRAPSGMATEF